MKQILSHPVYGEITYEENFWTGKKRLFVNGAELTPENKTVFLFPREDATLRIVVRGNSTRGVGF